MLKVCSNIVLKFNLDIPQFDEIFFNIIWIFIFNNKTFVS